jgi:hypothetical protein
MITPVPVPVSVPVPDSKPLFRARKLVNALISWNYQTGAPLYG